MTVQESTAAVPLPELSELDKLVLRLGVVQMHRTQRQQEEQDLRAKVVNKLRPGGKCPIYDPRDPSKKLWNATASETSFRAEVVDRTKAEDWVRENYPSKLRPQVKLKEGFTEADVLQIARRYAAYMFEEVDVVEPWVLNELKIKSQQAGRPMGWGNEIGEHAPPGIEVTKADSTITMTFTPAAAELLRSLIRDGVIDSDGNPTSSGGE